MSLRPGVEQAEHQQMIEKGFEDDVSGDYYRNVAGANQYISCIGTSDPFKPRYWVATAIYPKDSVQNVVCYAEGFTSPIVAFVTAEIRGWKAT